jgi:hypothetical protein
MMAFERTPPPPALDPETVEALRVALASSRAQGSHSRALHDVLARAATEARNKGIPAERLLLVLKDIWYARPDVARAPSSEAEQALLQELISRSIQEYYSE